ncbi:MAG: hypothetical protein FWD23_14285 [Oscillospiraceae bacterium]|nr:hypothetical protein [Oscillospiraceae bacterium]
MMRIKVLEYGFKQTLEEGRVEGRAEGKTEAKNQIKRIKSLYIAEHMTPAEIAEKEQITKEQVTEILELLGLVEP